MKIRFSLTAFLEELVTRKESLVYGCMSRPKDRKAPHKVLIRPIILKKRPVLLLEFHEKTRTITKHAPLEEAVPQLLQEYQELFLRFQEEEFQLVVTDTEVRGHLNKERPKVSLNLAHNREKNHILKEGVPIQFLIELGLMTSLGRVLPQAQDKFKQINRFLEMVRDLNYKPNSLVDLGCGKAYLTFALYHYYCNIEKHPVAITGVDIKDEVLERCQAIADKLQFTNLRFSKGTIQNFKPDVAPEMVVALHACNVASDHAIDRAIEWNSKVALIAPCCQHALYHSLKKSEYPAPIKQPLLQERYAALLTDARRAERLERAGFTVQVIEFIDPEHTPKNILIRASKN